ncbi:GntR family transcriptional regulator [Diaphorobacter ruginosibacter]|uniref:GntR family transcriptional regulator n=1 Tax=Diaphorobacter ruginosibacter TaxID=1715720 RepID=UPI00333F6978
MAIRQTTHSSAPATKRSLVLHQLVESIKKGQWTVNTLLPTEAQLQSMFGVSRHTVRGALADLQQMGLVASQQGVGTRVIRRRAAPGYSQSLQNISELAYYARNTSVQTLEVEDVQLNASEAEMLEAQVGDPWCHAITLRMADGQSVPMGLSSVWVPSESRKAIAASRRSGMPVFMEVQKLHKLMVNEVRQVIGATVADAGQSRLLRCELREPLLRIRRWYFDINHRVLEMSDTYHPPGRFEYSVTLHHGIAHPHAHAQHN